ncbi:thiol-disulfide oxidoreductase DCC family protein [Histidinibacterium aquaticum]|uniref:DUF393 domain-containing protein n=1 Tax=Histidinibacterium aquaticum TaxID=2613962 RepID=A0A5J5GIB8_9RHOB|nr:DUF393 domain-containing protein [Histidinibacterium aquaticum]KAA9007999.1 DUF393 domain-containing protein [Histidinibacterium aquaticum]
MTEDTRVLYNGDCPVCSFEIDRYADYSRRRGLPIRFDDLNGPELAEWGLTDDEAARRLYVLHEGELHGGLDGFLVLWRQMPRMRWLARVAGLPVIRPAASAVYEKVLAPVLYRRHLARRRRAVGGPEAE